jgi:hypothetical protein
MLTWILQSSIISIIFIYLVHHLIMFFKTTLTVPKIKDLVNSPNQKYKNIYDTISHNSASYTEIDLLPKEGIENETININMKNELKTFLKQKLNNENENNAFTYGENLSKI